MSDVTSTVREVPPDPRFLEVGVSSDIEIEYQAHDYHRNGVSGAGFWVFLIRTREHGKGRTAGYVGEWKRMVAILFDEAEVTHTKACAVLDRDLLANDDIRFGWNSWRGDRYVGALRFFLEQLP